MKMKKLFGAAAWAAIMILACVLPALAAEETGDAAADAAAPQLDFVTDAAGLLSGDQLTALNERARELSEEYGCGVYIVTVDDYRHYTSGSVYDCATGIFSDYDLGYGETGDGVLLLLSMAERDYSLIAHGDFGNAAFTDYGKECMSDSFLSYFAKNNWYGGFSDYLSTAEEYLEMAAQGQPFDVGDGSKAVRYGIVLLIPTLVSGIVSKLQSNKMKSVRSHTNASVYAAPTGLILRGQQDSLTHSTQSRTRIAAPISSGGRGGRGGRGGGTTIGRGGFSGRSGKF